MWVPRCADTHATPHTHTLSPSLPLSRTPIHTDTQFPCDCQQRWFHSQSFQNHIPLSAILSVSVYLSVFLPLILPPEWPPTHPTPLLLVGVSCASAKPLDTQPSALFDNLTPCLPRLQFPSSAGLPPGCCLVQLAHDWLNDWLIGSFVSILLEPAIIWQKIIWVMPVCSEPQ